MGTKVFVYILLVIVLISCGFILDSVLPRKKSEDSIKYNTDVKIEDVESFKEGMKENVGYAFIYGELDAVDTVSYEEVDGEYMYIEKATEQYIEAEENHINPVLVPVFVNNRYTPVNVPTISHENTKKWVKINSESKRSSRIKFKDIEFDSSKLNAPSITECIRTDYIDDNTRICYYVIDSKMSGTLFTYLGDNTISSNSEFYKAKSINETIKYLDSGVSRVGLWIMWFICSCIILCFIIGIDVTISNS